MAFHLPPRTPEHAGDHGAELHRVQERDYDPVRAQAELSSSTATSTLPERAGPEGCRGCRRSPRGGNRSGDHRSRPAYLRDRAPARQPVRRRPARRGHPDGLPSRRPTTALRDHSMTDRRPRHEQIAAELRDQVLSGDLAPGTLIPSTAHLVARFNAANATIQRALRNFKDAGFLDSRVGKGVYVRVVRPVVVEVAAYLPPGDGFATTCSMSTRSRRRGCRPRTSASRRWNRRPPPTHLAPQQRTRRGVDVVLPGRPCRWSAARPSQQSSQECACRALTARDART